MRQGKYTVVNGKFIHESDMWKVNSVWAVGFLFILALYGAASFFV